MTPPLRILLLEDNSSDAELIQELLLAEHGICEVSRVQTRDEFLAALRDPKLELILADYRLPSFDGLSALHLTLSERPGLPFIFVSGTLGEELAIEALKVGATDYVLKERLSRLVPSVQRALRESRERAERKKAEDALRRSEMYLAEAQRLSRTGSFGWDVASGAIYWSEETYRIFECEPSITPTIEMVVERTHPDDREHVQQVIDRAVSEKSGFHVEHRVVAPDGSIKHVHVVARSPAADAPESALLIGAITDVTERKRAEEELGHLRELERDLARISRVSTMGELAASLSHEIKQPIGGVSLNAEACLRWIASEPPALEHAREAVSRIIADAKRAASIVDRNRLLFSRETLQRERIDLNEVIREMVVMLRDAASRSRVLIRCALDPALPKVTADRIQLQQVLMNLMLNGIEAMHETGGELSIASQRTDAGELLVSVSDSGTGLSSENLGRIFEAFFTTKPQGTGMGLSISRRIIEAHGGRLWAEANAGRGATFQFTVPENADAQSR